ncbi:MAG TPA: hypothetical protein VJU79_10460, partial [Candidatus Dormibacteraeota bacterium]|nr:hypothetical protein [Candidatus Dormibacteraeota bacterium]
VVADLGSCLSETAVAVLRRATEVLVVAVPTLTGARDAYRSAAVVRRSVDSGTRVGLVVNRVVAGVDLDEVVADLRLPVLGCVPEDAELGAAENQRRLVTLDGHGGAAVALRRLVATLAPASVG